MQFAPCCSRVLLGAPVLTALARAVIEVDCLAPSSAAFLVAIADSDAHVSIVDLVTGEQCARFDAAGRASELFWCGSKLVSVAVDPASGSRTFECFDPASPRLVARRTTPPSDERTRSIPSPEGTRLLVPALGGQARILSVETLQDVASAAGPFTCGCWSPDGSCVYLGENDGMITELDARAGRVLHAESIGIRAVRCIAIDPGEKHLVAAGQDQIARVLDPTTWQRTATWVSKTDFPMKWNGFERMVLSPAGDVAYLSTTDWWSIQAWSLETNTCLWWIDFDGGNPHPIDIVLAPDGSRLAAVGYRTPRIFDGHDGRTCAAFANEERVTSPQSFAWSSDGGFFVIRSADRTRVTVHGGRALVPLYELVPSSSGLQRRTLLAAR